MRKLHSIVTDAVAHCLARTTGVKAQEVLDYLLSTSALEVSYM